MMPLLGKLSLALVPLRLLNCLYELVEQIQSFTIMLQPLYGFVDVLLIQIVFEKYG